MAAEIIQKIVEMRFNNNQFESGVKTSLLSLSKLKDALDFSGAKRGLEAISDTARNINFSVMGNAVDAVSNKFSMMQVAAITAMTDITRWAERTGKQLVKSLSTDQISSGWNKYIEKTASVQTIMNSTGLGIDDVNSRLEKLMRFSDQTSFSFNEMTSALAQMTSSGGDIEKLLPMITGIANATAFAGKGGREFQSTIRNLAQSYSAGFLQLQDMKSLNFMGTSSKQLKQTFIDMGVALGTIKEGEVTLENFDNSLSKKWANTEVMEKALGKFSEFYEAVDKAVEEGKYETFNDAIKEMAGDFDELSVRAFKSAQEAKSFSEAIEATKDAVSSGWLETFEIMFGNYEESKELWTDICDGLWDVFAAGAETRNAILKLWKADGGRDETIQAFWNLWEACGGITKAIKEGLGFYKKGEEEIRKSAKWLTSLTSSLQTATRNFRNFFIVYDDEEDEFVSFTKNGENLKKTFQGIGSVVKTVGYGLKQLGVIFDAVKKQFFDPEKLLTITAKLGGSVEKLMSEVRALINKAMVPLEHSVLTVSAVIKRQFTVISDAFHRLRDNFTIFKSINSDFFSFSSIISDTFNGVVNFISGAIPVIVGKFIGFANKLYDIFTSIISFFGQYKEGIFSFFKMLSGDAVRIFTFFYTKIEDIASGIITVIGKVAKFLINHRDIIYSVFMSVRGVIFMLMDAFDLLWEKLKTIPGIIGNILNRLKATSLGQFFLNLLDSIKEAIFGIQKSIDDLGKVNTDGASKFTERIKSIFAPFTFIWSGVKKVFEGLHAAFTAFGPTIISIGNALATVIGSIFNGLKALVDGGSMQDFIRIMGEGTIVGMLLKKLFSNKSSNPIKEFTSTLEALTEGIQGVFGSLKDTLNAFQEGLKAKALKEIAVAVGILAASILVLSTIDPVKLATSLLAIKVSFQSLISTMDVLSNYHKDRIASIKLLAPVLTKVAIAMVAMAIAMRILGKLDLANLAGATAAVGVALKMLSLTISEIADLNLSAQQAAAIKKLAPLIKSIGMSVLMIAIAVRIMGKMDLTEVAVGVGAVMALIATLVYSMQYLANKLTNSKGLLGVAVVITALTGVIVTSALAIAALSFIPFEKLQNGIIGFAAILTGIGAFMFAISNMNIKIGQMLAVAASMVIMSGALAMMAAAVAVISLVPGDKLVNGITALAVTLGGLMVLLNLPLASPAKMIGIAGAMAIMGASLLLLVPGIVAMSLIPVKSCLKVIAMLGLLVAGMAIAAKVLGPSVVVLLQLAGAFALLGLGMAALGVGLTTIMAAGVTLDAFVGLLMEVLYRLLDYIIELIPFIIVQIGKGIIDLLVVLRDAIPPLIEVCYEAIVGVCKLIVDCLPMLLDTVGFILLELIKFVLSFGPPLIQGLVDIFLMIPVEISKAVPRVIMAFWDMIINIIDGISEGLVEFAPRLRKAIVNLCKSLWDAFLAFFRIGSPSKLFAEGGGYLVQGLINGIKNFIPNAVKTVGDLCTGLWGKFKSLFKIGSPSKLFKEGGKFLMQGLAIGINGTSKLVTKSMDKVNNYVAGMSGDWGKNINAGFVKGLTDNAGSIFEAVSDINHGIDTTVRDFFGIHSPSTWGVDMSKNNIQGSVLGANKYAPQLIKTAGDIAEETSDEVGKATTNSIKKTTNAIDASITAWQKDVKKPVVEATTGPSLIGSGLIVTPSEALGLNGVNTSVIKDLSMNKWLESVSDPEKQPIWNELEDTFEEIKKTTSQAANVISETLTQRQREKNVTGTYGDTSSSTASNASKKKFTAITVDSVNNSKIVAVVDATSNQNASSIASTAGSNAGTAGAANAAQSSTSARNDNIDYAAIVKKQFADDITKIVKELYDIRQDIKHFESSVSTRQVVLDTGTLVGELSNGIDKNLGTKTALATRGA